MVRRGVPRVFCLRAPVWQADVDAFGELRSSTLLRFLQETATRASTDAGFAPSFYERQATFWLVRRTTLARHAPARYGDDLEARTWVADVRRVRSRRDYEVRAGERLVAQAWTDWVYVDRASGQPRRVPTEMQRAFLPEEIASLPRPPFAAPAPPSDATRSGRRVELQDLDALAHVNNATYLHYVEQAADDAHAAGGWPLARQLGAGGRLRPVAHDLEYLDAAVYGDELAVLTWATGVTDDEVARYTIVTRRTDACAPVTLLRVVSRYAWTDMLDVVRAMPADLRTAVRARA